MMPKKRNETLIRVFDGKNYRFSKATSYKAEAKGAAARHRRSGSKARVVKTFRGYEVYVRG